MKGICTVSVAPMRAEKSDSAEMVSQILYGESVDILQIEDNWTRVKMHYDDYEGWIDTKQIERVEDELLEKRTTTLIQQPYQAFPLERGHTLLSLGSEIPIGSDRFISSENIENQITATAKSFLNVPYLWGGRSYFGIDCSGFTQIVYKIFDLKLPRDAWQQAQFGEDVAFVGEATPGDLAFFIKFAEEEDENPKIIHVGIMLNNSAIIHAHGKVRIDRLDSTGIFNEEQNRYTHKLRFIKRFI